MLAVTAEWKLELIELIALGWAEVSGKTLSAPIIYCNYQAVILLNAFVAFIENSISFDHIQYQQ